MAIDLPPVMPPQLATQQQIEQARQYHGSYVERRINGVLLRVQQAPYLSAEQLQQLLSGAASPSAAITALSRHYYNMGRLLVSLSYFRHGDTVTVMVSQGRLNGLRGNPRLTHFFTGLVGDNDLQLTEFDRARVPAALYAERAGLEYSISYEQHADGEVILDFIERPAAEHASRDFELELNNRGSRFLGRYFARLGAVQRFGTGAELRAGYQTVISDWGETGDGDDYQQLDLSLDQPFRFGLYGVELSHTVYERSPEVQVTSSGGGLCLPPLVSCPPSSSVTTLALEAEIQQASLRGEQLLYSNPLRRLNLFERLSYVDSRIEPQGGGEALLDERYAVLQLGLRYTLREKLWARPAFARLELAADLGLSDDDGSFATESARGVAIGRRSAEFVALKPKAALNLALGERSELRASLQGQWANGVQLPQQQQWVLGGGSSLAAWLPGTLIGDDGVLTNVALQQRYRWRGLSIKPALFLEYGAARFNDSDDELGDWQSLADIGLGLSVDSESGLHMQLAAAAPLLEEVADTGRLGRQQVDFFWTLRWQL